MPCIEIEKQEKEFSQILVEQIGHLRKINQLLVLQSPLLEQHIDRVNINVKLIIQLIKEWDNLN